LKKARVKSVGQTALTGVCEYCDQTFSSPSHIVGPASKIEIEKQFEAHTCKRLDASQTAMRIGRESTEQKRTLSVAILLNNRGNVCLKSSTSGAQFQDRDHFRNLG
jgi:hypothetical protein